MFVNVPAQNYFYGYQTATDVANRSDTRLSFLWYYRTKISGTEFKTYSKGHLLLFT